MSILKAERVTFSYNDETGLPPVLDGVSLSVEEGQFVAVLGRNGSGKSTLAKHFNAVLLPRSGDVWVNGLNTRDGESLLAIRQTVGMVFQNPDNQIVATVVEEDVAFALENIGTPPAEIRERVDWALRAVNLYDCRENAPHQLSGGQKQRVAIAGVLAMRPRCIVLDEPTAMLDPKGRDEVLRALRELNREYGITVILITHCMEEAALCDRVLVLDAGRILMDGRPEKVFEQVGRLRAVHLDVPRVTELLHELKRKGYPVRGDVITEEGAVRELRGLLERKGARRRVHD